VNLIDPAGKTDKLRRDFLYYKNSETGDIYGTIHDRKTG
jgi:hypothetical protein